MRYAGRIFGVPIWLYGLAVCAALLACGENSGPAVLDEIATEPAPAVTQTPSPEESPLAVSELGELLRRVDAAMASLSSGRGVAEVEATIEYSNSEEHFSSTTEGDFQTPDLMHYRTIVDGGGFSLETETIAVGTDSWTRVTSFAPGPWEKDSSAPAGSVLALGLFDMRFDAATEEHFELAGEVELDGEAVYHLKGGSEVVQVPNVTAATSHVNRRVEYWIGLDDYLVRKAVLFSEASFSVPTFSDQQVRETVRQTSEIVVTLSEYGKAVDIQAPDLPAEEPTTSAVEVTADKESS